MIDQDALFKESFQILKSNSFKKKGTTWNKTIDDHTVWVVNFQKGKSATKEKFDITINVGVYIKGSMSMLFNKEPEFVLEPYCFFRQRPRFFGLNADWWDFDEDSDPIKATAEITVFLKEMVIPFLEGNKNVDKLATYLPIEKWRKTLAFHSQLLWVAVAYLLTGKKDVASDMLRTISADKNGWSENADRILNEMN